MVGKVDGPGRAVDARSAAPGRSSGAVRRSAEGEQRAALEAALRRARRDREDCVGLAPDAPARIRGTVTRVRARAASAAVQLHPTASRAALVGVCGMILYAAGTAGLAALVKPILNETLPKQQQLSLHHRGDHRRQRVERRRLVRVVVPDGRRRAACRDGRCAMSSSTTSSGSRPSFFAQRTSGQLLSRINNDVGQVQQAVSETAGDFARETLTVVGLVALMFYFDARLTLVCMTGAPLVVYPLIRLGQRVRRTTRRSQEALEHISHITAEAFTGHRIVKAFGTEAVRGRQIQSRRNAPVSDEHEGDRLAVEPSAADGARRRSRHGRGALVRQLADCGGTAGRSASSCRSSRRSS